MLCFRYEYGTMHFYFFYVFTCTLFFNSRHISMNSLWSFTDDFACNKENYYIIITNIKKKKKRLLKRKEQTKQHQPVSLCLY